MSGKVVLLHLLCAPSMFHWTTLSKCVLPVWFMAQCKKNKKTNYFGPWCYTCRKKKKKTLSWAWLWSPGPYPAEWQIHCQKEKITGRQRQKHSKRSRWGINGRGLVHMQLGWRVIQSRCAGGWGRSGDGEWQVHWGYCSADGSGRIWTTADEKADNENVGENLLICDTEEYLMMQERCNSL